MSETPNIRSLDPEEARRLTDRVRERAAELWSDLLRLYEGGAHRALGYSSWGAYYQAEFGQDASRGYQLLRSARVVEAIEASGSSSTVDLNAYQADALARDPEPAAAWSAAVERHGEPTALQVREVVEERRTPEPAASLEVIDAGPRKPLTTHRIGSVFSALVFIEAEIEAAEAEAATEREFREQMIEGFARMERVASRLRAAMEPGLRLAR